MTPRAWLVVVICVLTALIPQAEAALLGATLLSLHLLVRPSGDGRLQAAGAILLAVTVNLLWTRVGLLFLAQPLQELDAWLVGVFGGVAIQDNVLTFADGSGKAHLVRGCMSLNNASMALMVWLAVTRTFRPRFRRSDLYWAAATFSVVVALNIGRLSVIMQSRANYDLLHEGAGAELFGVLFLAAALVMSGLTVRRELF